MDDNFSPRVKDVITYSKEEALRLGLVNFVCDPANVENKATENDEVHGRNFHTVRSSVDATAIGKWQRVLPQDVAAWLVEEYPSIQDLAHGTYRS